MIPKWNFPAISWNRPNAMRKMNGPARSASSWRSGFKRIGFRIETVLRQIWRVLMPSSSRRGGSSSKDPEAEMEQAVAPEVARAEEEQGEAVVMEPPEEKGQKGCRGKVW